MSKRRNRIASASPVRATSTSDGQRPSNESHAVYQRPCLTYNYGTKDFVERLGPEMQPPHTRSAISSAKKAAPHNGLFFAKKGRYF